MCGKLRLSDHDFHRRTGIIPPVTRLPGQFMKHIKKALSYSIAGAVGLSVVASLGGCDQMQPPQGGAGTGSLQDSTLHDGSAQIVEMALQIPESQLVLVNGGDHPLMWSRPERFRRAVDAFLASLHDNG